MALPKDAKLEKELPWGVAIYDVSHVLPVPKNPRSNVRPNGTNIKRVFYHHSGAYGRDGFQGVENSVRFVIERRDFGARPYHFWLAIKPDIDNKGNLVVYRMAKDDERSWHTGARANDEGVGVVWQGDLSPDGDGEPSKEQYKMAEVLVDWLIDRYKLSLPDGLSFHAEGAKWGGRNKSSCPGPFVEEWVKKRRQEKEESSNVNENEESDKKDKSSKNESTKESARQSSKSKEEEKERVYIDADNKSPGFYGQGIN